MTPHPTTPPWWIGAGLAVFLACAAQAPAAITLHLRTGTHVARGRVEVVAVVSNAGPEAAYAVQTEASWGGTIRRESPNVGSDLEGGDSIVCRWTFDLSSAIPGEHVAIVRLRYVDANGHLYSTVAAAPFLIAEFPPKHSALQVRLAPVSVRKGATGRLSVSHWLSPSCQITIDLIVPDEFRCNPRRYVATLNPGETEEQTFQLENVSALPGSRYPVLAVAHSVVNGRHVVRVAASSIRVLCPSQPFYARKDLWTFVGVTLVLASMEKGRRKRASAHTGRTTPVSEAPSSFGAGSREDERTQSFAQMIEPCVTIVVVTAFVAAHLAPGSWGKDTVTAGGDTPAHLYLVTHLRESLRSGGGIVSWAGGWWCGFPMFQFYFWLPYLATALVGWVVPLNTAFKLMTVSGALTLPLCAWVFARKLGWRPPAAHLLVMAMVPLLFDRTHQMWGVNLYSTLAGMIANSISFSIFLLFLANAWRDAEEGVPRLGTAALLVALVGSHFFTSLLALMIVAILPVLRPRPRWGAAAWAIALEMAIGLLLSAWWLLPLLAKQSHAVAFGTDWEVSVSRWLTSPRPWVMPLAVGGGVIGWVRRERSVGMIGVLMALAATFFLAGTRLGGVFVNIRFWPFLVFASLSLAAYGAGGLVDRLPHPRTALTGLLILTLTWGPGQPNTVAALARWNYEGLQAKPAWRVLERLVLPLRGTPGRLANDLHEANSCLGSTRVFEVVPALIGKPVLEGGLVNSAEGALFSYYVQSETSRSCAGFPVLTKPATFDMDQATRHLELFNVKHFIARWEGTRRALSASSHWRKLGEEGSWELYELMTHEGRYVVVPKSAPLGVRTTNAQQAGLEWIYHPAMLNQPFALLHPNELTPPEMEVVDEAEYARRLAKSAMGPLAWPETEATPVIRESVTDRRIRFTTTAVGRPHVIKCSYFPNWTVRGAGRIYRVTPNFMLVYPTQSEVELVYGSTKADRIGRWMSWTGLAAAGFFGGVRFRRFLRRRSPVSLDGAGAIGAF